MPYPTLEQGRDSGLTGSDADVRAALDAAVTRVEWFCRDTFTPETRTVAAMLDRGLALLPMRVSTVTEVRVPGAADPIPATAYVVTSSAVQGQPDAIRMLNSSREWRAYAGFLVEPVRHQQWQDGVTVEVTGTFGWADTPAAVSSAVLRLARQHQRASGVSGDAGQVNLEGDVDLPPRRISEPVVTPDGALDTAASSRSTGDTFADQLLAPYVRPRLVVT